MMIILHAALVIKMSWNIFILNFCVIYFYLFHQTQFEIFSWGHENYIELIIEIDINLLSFLNYIFQSLNYTWFQKYSSTKLLLNKRKHLPGNLKFKKQTLGVIYCILEYVKWRFKKKNKIKFNV